MTSLNKYQNRFGKQTHFADQLWLLAIILKLQTTESKYICPSMFRLQSKPKATHTKKNIIHFTYRKQTKCLHLICYYFFWSLFLSKHRENTEFVNRTAYIWSQWQKHSVYILIMGKWTHLFTSFQLHWTMIRMWHLKGRNMD